MKFPYTVLENLDKKQLDKWNKYYKDIDNKYLERDRKIEEGIWRRSQMFGTRRESNWKRQSDQRRRMIHYHYKYDVLKHGCNHNLCMTSAYIWILLTFPKEEIHDYVEQIEKGLEEGKWKLISESAQQKIFKKEDLFFLIEMRQKEKEDIEIGRIFPDLYVSLEIKIYSQDMEEDQREKKKVWDILNNGPRQKDVNGSFSTSESVDVIRDYLPAHVELGCGPSIEAGIPPLNFLHDVYYVTNKETGRFILGSQKDLLAYKIAADTNNMFHLFSEMYRRCFIAKPETDFYVNLKKLFEMGVFINPLFTNNFDGLPLQLGIDEFYLRRYELENIVPKIQYDERAKSLISIGCHADRRKVQESARKAGLKVIHIDPEGYHNENGEMIPYELEAKKDGDIFIKKEASRAFQELVEIFEKNE